MDEKLAEASTNSRASLRFIIGQLRVELADLRADRDRLAAEAEALRAACEMVLRRWTLNRNQCHTHTWHDWADCKPLIDAALVRPGGG